MNMKKKSHKFFHIFLIKKFFFCNNKGFLILGDWFNTGFEVPKTYCGAIVYYISKKKKKWFSDWTSKNLQFRKEKRLSGEAKKEMRNVTSNQQ